MNLKNKIFFWRAKNKGLVVGKNFSMFGNVDFGSEPFLIKIGDNVRVTNNVSFITHDGGVHVIRTKFFDTTIDKIDKIVIGNNVFIGVNSVILPGVKIGNNVIIGAGSVVTKNIPDNSVAVGNPCKTIETIDDYYAKNKNIFLHCKELTKKRKKEFLLKKFKE